MCHAESHPGLSRTPGCSTRPPPDSTASQEAGVPALNSRVFWQFRESCAWRPSLPPPLASLIRGPAKIYRSGKTGIGSSVAISGPLCFLEF